MPVHLCPADAHCFCRFEVTMTLPGVAGFLLSLGMAVDANIIIYERLKEEIKSGKTCAQPMLVSNGVLWQSWFKRNHPDCRGLLYYFGTGPIKSLLNSINRYSAQHVYGHYHDQVDPAPGSSQQPGSQQ